MRFFPRLFRRASSEPAPVEPQYLAEDRKAGASSILKSIPLPALMPRFNRGPQWRDWSTRHAFREGYQASSWVFICVEKRRRAVASVPWFVEVKRGGEWQRDPDHPLQKLIDDPNPDMGQRELMSRLVQWMDLGGNAYWLKVRGGRGNLPLELWPVMPDAMRVIAGGIKSGSLVAGYRYDWRGVRRDFEAADVAHFAHPNPDDFHYGMPLLRAAGASVDIDTEAQSYQKVSLQNRGIPDGVFTLADDTTNEQWEQAREQVREQYQTKDAYRAPWVVARASWQQMSMSAVELDYVKSRGITRQEICSVFDVPLPLVHVYDDATLANVQTAKRIFWEDGIIPLLDDLCSHLNSALTAEFGNTDQIRIVYDVSNVAALQQKFGEKVESADRLWRMGVPLSQVNQRLELGLDTDEITGSDVGYVPAGLLPVFEGSGIGDQGGAGPADSDQTQAPAGEPGDGSGTDPDRALNGAQVDAVLRIIESVALGELPRDSAIAVIAAAFPITREQAEDMLGEVGRTFFVEPDTEPEQRSAQLAHVKARIERYRRMTHAEAYRLAYGDE